MDIVWRRTSNEVICCSCCPYFSAKRSVADWLSGILLSRARQYQVTAETAWRFRWCRPDLRGATLEVLLRAAQALV